MTTDRLTRHDAARKSTRTRFQNILLARFRVVVEETLAWEVDPEDLVQIIGNAVAERIHDQ
jgi:hypothetical protein